MAKIPSYLYLKKDIRVLSLFLIILLVFGFNLSWATKPGISLSITKVISCHGVADGTITVTGTGVTNYQFSRDKSTWSPDPTSTASTFDFKDLPAGNYRIYVRDGDNITDLDSADIELTEPTILSIGVGGQKWTCGTPCNGQIELTITGGTPPYSSPVVTLEGVTIPAPYENLCEGIYLIDATDSKGCIAEQKKDTIKKDITAPVCSYYPTDTLLNITHYSPVSKLDSSNLVSAPNHTFIGGKRDTISYSRDASTYNNVQVKIYAHQTDNPNAWDSSDSLQLAYSLNNGTTWKKILTDWCQWTAEEKKETGNCSGNTFKTGTNWINLDDATGISGFRLRVICNTGAIDRQFILDSLWLKFNQSTGAVDPIVSGQPAGCTDDFVIPKVTYKDTLMHWFCNSNSNLEFKFNRIWEITDDCNNKTRRTQHIAVGASPTFVKLPADTILDFCHNADATIIGPTATDNCYFKSITWAVTVNALKVSPRNGTGNSATLTFPQPVTMDTTYVITWTATDSAGFTNKITQTIGVKQKMSISMTPDSYNFCSGSSIGFTFSVIGGTMNFKLPEVSPTGTFSGWSSPNLNGKFTTMNLKLEDITNLSITWEDNSITEIGGTTGGCSTTKTFLNNSDYKIRTKISTNSLQREPR